jgi:hypothetical protein
MPRRCYGLQVIKCVIFQINCRNRIFYCLVERKIPSAGSGQTGRQHSAKLRHVVGKVPERYHLLYICDSVREVADPHVTVFMGAKRKFVRFWWNGDL